MLLKNFYKELLTEVGPEDQLRKPGAGGKAIPNTEARVVDEQMRDVVPGRKVYPGSFIALKTLIQAASVVNLLSSGNTAL
ncbi:MAG: hypothetical protein NVSMB49_19180 [Ktedonobacteraceae bacterium]